jgi:cytoskeletal protein RodZ
MCKMSNAESLGKIFQKKRQELGFDIETVASRTYMNVKVINEIESGVFDKLSPVYMKSFIKKYSNFLALDMEDMLKRYEEISREAPLKGFSVKTEPANKKEINSSPVKASLNAKPEDLTKKKKMALKAFPSGKNPQTLVAVALFFVLGLLVFVLVNVTKNVLTSPPREVLVVPTERSLPQKKDSATGIQPAKTLVKKPSRVPSGTEVVSLTLKARDRAWVQLGYPSGKKLFDGFLNAGDSRTWKAEGSITVWTGKAEMLNFTVNGNDLGTVAAGVVKNIKVSADGVMVGDDWVKTLR